MTKILVTEDDHFIASAYKLKLAKAGFEVQVAYDGDEALQILTHFTPDLILLDLIMPKKDGFSVLKELKNLPQYREIPVIIASNLGQKEDIDKALQLGARDYIVKSDMSMEDLVSKINSLLPR